MDNKLILGYKYDEGTSLHIDIWKDGKYIYMKKPHANENKEYRMDLTNGEFQRINHYKTTGTKINTTDIANITKWFSDCSLFCNDEKFVKTIIFCKLNWNNNRFKNPVRFIQALTNSGTQIYESWLSLGIDITEINKKIRAYQEGTRYGVSISGIRIRPQDFSKKNLKYIKKNFKMINEDMLQYLERLDREGYSFNLIDELFKKTSHPRYNSYFKVYNGYRNQNNKYNLFDIHQEHDWTNSSLLQIIISTIGKFNLDIDTLLDYCLKLYHTEGLDLRDMFGTRHYRDYLNIEKKLKDNKMSKMDKYPDNFLTKFHIAKKEYAIREKELNEKTFKKECDKARHLEAKYDKYSIIVPEKTADIEHEANELGHCVRIYIPRVIDGETLILFIRDNDNLDTPLVTLEVKDNCLLQAYGARDTKPSEEILDVLTQWAHEKNIDIGWVWRF